MLREIKRQLYVMGKTYAFLLLLFVAIAIIISTGLYTFAKAMGDTDEFFDIGTLLLYGSSFVGFLVISIMDASSYYGLAVKMGAVRKNYIASAAVKNIVLCFAMLLLSGLWRYVDTAITSLIGINLTLIPKLPVHIAAVMAVAVNIVGLWMGALGFRYGRNGFWVSYAVFMVFTLGAPRVTAMLEGENNFISRIIAPIANALGVYSGIALWIVAALALIGLGTHTALLMYWGEAKD